ncbi:glycosyltransferase family protein [Paraburkholderia ginsengisoli]|uniref:hypothetical protein n=1 Tax=Paraburkholderia ginsengisoli TaxID=311231 RepID=UPI000A72D758|nr:hypothetical protein [Paraburkholderia ginsengisoli]
MTEETKHLYPIGEIHHRFSLTDRVVANSKIGCDTLVRIFDLPQQKIVSVLNGVEQSFYEPVEPELFRSEFGIQDRFVLNVDNIQPRKNQLALIRAMKSLPELTLVLIGHQRGPESAKACFAEGAD